MNREEFLQQIRLDYRPDLVAIDEQAIERLDLPRTAELASVDLPFAVGSRSPVASAHDDVWAATRYLLAMTALQYRFWAVSASGELVRYQHDGLVGSAGLARAFATAWGPLPEPGEGILAATRSVEDLADQFGASLPDLASRHAILREVMSLRGVEVVALVLNEVRATQRVDIPLAARIAEMLPAAYGDRYLKKAMLFLAFVAGTMGRFLPVEVDLCAYADYQVPNVLHHHQVLRYSPELKLLIARYTQLRNGGVEERAIRSATVLACEDAARVHGTTSPAFDWWCFQQRKLPAAPFHLTEDTTNY